jgi:type IV pilus assembly protein PilA
MDRDKRNSAEDGFTLIEILVVILIVGILSAIAVPSFVNQREKAQDTCAKSLLMTARTAMETYLVDHGNYAGVTQTDLNTIESAIPTNGSCGTTNSLVIGDAGGGVCQNAPTAPSYCLMVLSPGGPNRPFVFNRFADGKITRICGALAGGQNGGSCAQGTW